MGLISRWPLDDNAANKVVADSVGSNTGTSIRNTNLMSVLGTPTGRGLLFDGADDKITVPAHSSIDVKGKTAISITAWINPASDGEEDTGRIADKAAGGNGHVFFVSGETAGLVTFNAVLATTGGTASATTLTDIVPINVWSLVAFVYNEDGAGKIKLYLNGVLQSLLTDDAGNTTPADDSSNDLIIGNRAGDDRAFDGSIADARFHNTALTLVEMQAIYRESSRSIFGWRKSNSIYVPADDNSVYGGNLIRNSLY